MKLDNRFYQLPLLFDPERLSLELAQVPAHAWTRHPSGYEGNSALILLSANGGENDDMSGAMLPTPWLDEFPYVKQILDTFDSVWGRSRFMRLEGESEVPLHTDIHYHWHDRVRIHVPVITDPEVLFHCGDEAIHMAPGEAWIFDAWTMHRVVNPKSAARIHLVADTTGSASFWKLVKEARTPEDIRLGRPWQPRTVAFDPAANPQVHTETFGGGGIMHPADAERLIAEIIDDVEADQPDANSDRQVLAFRQALSDFCFDWRCAWNRYGDADNEGVHQYQGLLSQLEAAASRHGAGLVLASNGSSALTTLRKWILQIAFNQQLFSRASPARAPAAPEQTHTASAGFRRPVIILAAPRSGSTFLFETLAQAAGFYTVGGESHGVFEGINKLRPGVGSLRSNRLTADYADPETGRQLLENFTQRLVDRDGQKVNIANGMRLLEKTPKNALRVPFLNALFPDALFIYLTREPRSNISSIMEAWRSGGFVTYRHLPTWPGTWSLLLPPDWEQLAGQPLAEIARFQWASSHQHIMADLEPLPRERWLAVDHADLLADTPGTIERICLFADIPFDEQLQSYVAQETLPMSRHTVTAPAPDKWRKNEGEMQPVLAQADQIWAQVQGFTQAGDDPA
ncbi:MAG: hypothetical protein HKN19_12715 [Halioglobus sp.]|nr:hypothetical protein [Halioglobus sp.]